jgi:heme/copper-type cytochrome/quinol oxidase subunit 2
MAAMRTVSFFLLVGAALAVSVFSPTMASRAGQDEQVQVIEVTTKKYVFNPSPIRVKQGTRVRLRFTALDKDHGFQVNPYADGADAGSAPGLVFAPHDDCVTLVKGTPTEVEFVAQTAGTYSFKCCNFCGLGHKGMKGQIIVESAG